MNTGVVTLVFAILLNAVANIFMKVGMSHIGKTTGLPALVKKAVGQPAVLAGMACFVLALVAYSMVLTKLNLSVAYPIMVSMGLVVVVVASAFILLEHITWLQVVGFVLIIAGVWMVAR